MSGKLDIRLKMTPTKFSYASVFAAAFLLMSTGCISQPVPTSGMQPTLFDIIDGFLHEPKIDKGTVERLLPLKLTLASTVGSNHYFARSVKVKGGLITEVNFHEFQVDSKMGHSLDLTIGGVCISRTSVTSRFSSLTEVDVKTGDGLQSTTTWTQDTPWGHIVFGFDMHGSECLRDVFLEDVPPIRARLLEHLKH